MGQMFELAPSMPSSISVQLELEGTNSLEKLPLQSHSVIGDVLLMLARRKGHHAELLPWQSIFADNVELDLNKTFEQCGICSDCTLQVRRCQSTMPKIKFRLEKAPPNLWFPQVYIPIRRPI